MSEKYLEDDIADGLLRDGISREAASREGRPEGQTVVVDVGDEDNGEIISFGRPEILQKLNTKLNRQEIKHRMVEVGRWPSEPEEQLKVRQIFLPRFSEAAKRLGGPAKLIGNLLESAEETIKALPSGPLGKPEFRD